jgi:hypothetical protein
MSGNIAEYFAPLEDPRIENKMLHMLVDIVLLTFARWSAVRMVGRRLRISDTKSWSGYGGLPRFAMAYRPALCSNRT